MRYQVLKLGLIPAFLILMINADKYYSILGSIQNEDANVNSDIMSFTALMNDEEKIEHLKRYASKNHDALQVHNMIQAIKGELIGE